MPRRKRDADFYQQLQEARSLPDKPDPGRRPGSYPLTIPEWIDMYQDQRGKCALCEKEMLVFSKAFMDHNHITGKVRGLLCSKCNTTIKYFADDVALLESITEYGKRGLWDDDK